MGGADGIVRLISCGSVDDGKSTLIGRLLHDAGVLMDDAIDTLARDSRRHGTTGDVPDLALLLDGLEAEREQGITIDIAWRHLITPRRRFLIADTPGHEQYTRNMASAASTADIGILLVDARKGLSVQTRRHAHIVAMMGVGRVVLAVNKMDLVGHAQARFAEIAADFARLAEGLGLAHHAIPISALSGANVSRRDDAMAWHDGPPLLEWLEIVPVAAAGAGPLRMAVQWVNRPHADFRGLAGSIFSGRVAVGDDVVVARSGVAAQVARIVTADADLPAAQAGDAVTLVLASEVDVARGDLIVAAADRPQLARQFAAHLVWLHEDAAMPGRVYQLKCAAFSTTASITSLKHVIDMADGTARPARTLAMNEIGQANLETASPLAFDAYADNRDTGSFILIDRFSKATVGAGMIDFTLRRATNIHTQALSVSPQQRSALKGHGPAVIWFTGLSGSGKSTIANAVEAALAMRGVHTTALDGDNIRHGLNRDLGFTEADRVENIRRIAEVGRLMLDAGLVVTCAFISPFRAERQLARETIGAARFIEVFVDTPIAACMARDPKGLYAKAQAGALKNFTGVDSPYEPPEAPDLVIDTTTQSADMAAARVIALLEARGIFA